MICKFCDCLQGNKRLDREFNIDKEPSRKLHHSYTAALISHSWTSQYGKRNACRSLYYRNRGLGFELNFCPECGKKISKRRRDKNNADTQS